MTFSSMEVCSRHGTIEINIRKVALDVQRCGAVMVWSFQLRVLLLQIIPKASTFGIHRDIVQHIRGDLLVTFMKFLYTALHLIKFHNFEIDDLVSG